MTAKFDPVAFWNDLDEMINSYGDHIRALVAEAAKQQARRDAEICKSRARHWDGDPPQGDEEFVWPYRAEEAEWCAQAIEREAGLSQDVPTGREG